MKTYKEFLLEYFREVDRDEKVKEDYMKLLPLKYFDSVKDTFIFQSYLTYLKSKYHSHQPICYKTWRDFEIECPEVIRDKNNKEDRKLNDIYCLFILGMGWT